VSLAQVSWVLSSAQLLALVWQLVLELLARESPVQVSLAQVSLAQVSLAQVSLAQV